MWCAKAFALYAYYRQLLLSLYLILNVILNQVSKKRLFISFGYLNKSSKIPLLFLGTKQMSPQTSKLLCIHIIIRHVYIYSKKHTHTEGSYLGRVTEQDE